MAYATGGGGNVVNLLNAIRDFAVGLGWTIAKQGTSGTGSYLFLQKGIAAITMQSRTDNTVTAYPAGGGAAVTTQSHQIRAFANTSINTALTTWFGHPGYPRGSSEDLNYGAIVGDLTGPLGAWHLFSNATGDYVHVAVQTTADRFVHFGFGLLDKGSMTHSGAAYVTGAENVWYPNSSQTDPASGSLLYNKPANAKPPFGPTSSLYIPNALPAGYGTTACSSNGLVSIAIPRYPIFFQNTPAAFPTFGTDAGLLGHIIGASTAGWSGTVPLFGIPALIQNLARTRHCVIGMYPDVRLLNMEGMIPGQEITLTTDTWKVFPIMRQEPWSSSGTKFAASTGQYAMAYKKVP